jgi:hypothetical protein
MNLEEKPGGENGVLFLASLEIKGDENAAISLLIMRQ